MKRKINIIGLTLFFTLTLFALAFSQESMTITTYYPSPYGSYNELGTNKLAVDINGVAVPSEYAAMNNGDAHIGRSLIVGAGGSGFAYDEGVPSVDGNVIIKGSVGIGIASPGWLLHVNGSAAKPGGGSWTDSSDIRLKKNVKPIENAVEKMLGLKGVKFEWKEQSRAKLFPGVQIGMVAQDVEKVFPQWVSADKDGYKDLTFRGFEALTVEAIRELKAENDALKAKIEVLESKLNVR